MTPNHLFVFSRRAHVLMGLLSCLFASACGGGGAGLTSKLSTDLDITGNARVVRNFQAYRENTNSGCSSAGTQGRRILISGFGPFNRKRNISGAVVDVLQRPELWPSQLVWPDDGAFEAPEFEPDDQPSRWGAQAVQRTVRFDGRQFELCLLKLSVEWDFAAAVILHEAEKFQPDFIFMSGYGADLTGVRLESAALNKTSRLSGFDPQGKALGELNTPLSKWILPAALNLPDVLQMNWDPRQIARANAHRLAQVSESSGRTETQERWRFVATREADPQNNYICNNVSYAVLAALQLESTPLAGGRLVMSPRFSKKPAAAFMHFPYEADVSSPEEVWLWAHLVMSVASAALPVESSMAGL
jgi:pyrrolidone-carboxylate peptidase